MRKVVLFLAACSVLSIQAAQPASGVNGHFYRLFAPLTFYHSVANRQFSVLNDGCDSLTQAIDRVLLNVYLTRPDLVKNTETKLQEAGTIRDDVNVPIVQHVELVEQVDPTPAEVEVEPVQQLMVKKPKFWTMKGDGSLQFMQNYVSENWYKGGESYYSALGRLTLEANYDNKSRWKWDNKLELKLGFQTSKSDSLHKFKTNEDLIRYTGKVGLQATKRWYYTMQLIAYTQFLEGLKSNDRRVYSNFLSPLNLNVGLGMDYKLEALKKRLTGTVNISPLAVNYRYVERSWFEKKKADDPKTWSWFPSRYGIEAGKHHLLDLGSQLTANLEWKINDNVTWKSRLYAFTSYKRTEVEWENTFALRVSKFISANLFLYPRFDDAGRRDEGLGFFQFKEYSSLGFSYSF